MKTRTAVSWNNGYFIWQIFHRNWSAISECSYTRRHDAVRGLNRFLQRVRAK